MPHTLENIEENKVKFTLTIPTEEVEAGMKAAAERLSQETKIDGFRPGKATYEVIKQRVGEMKLIEEAAEELIRSAFLKAMLEENLDTVGQPFFNMEKMAPGNDMVVTAEIALFPKVTKMADADKLSVKKQSTEPTQEMLDQAKKDLARMQTKETRAPKDHVLKMGDKAVVEMTMKRDGVVLEGGHAQNHAIYTGEPYYIEGFVDKLLGAKEGETRNFTLKFPKEHYQKQLADQEVAFEVKVDEIFELDVPELDDKFAKSVGMNDAAALEAQLRKNLEHENEHEEAIRQEKAVLDAMVEKSDFGNIPDLLVNQELEKMLHELKHNLSQQGGVFEDYLKSINKTLPELKLELTPAAIVRIKVAILLKEIIKQQDLKVEDKKIEAELDRIAGQYKDQKELRDRVYSPEYREFLTGQLLNLAAVDYLKEKIIK